MTSDSLARRVRSALRRPVTWFALAALAAVAAVGLALFQPWKLWVDRTVNEPAPAQPLVGRPDPQTAPAPPAEPAVLARGTFIAHEHPTMGTVTVIRTADGQRYLRLENLDTTNGPALRVWLSDAEVLPGRAGWRVFDGRPHVDLGALKGNKGSQNYPIPDDVDLARYQSVSIWCERFHVSFGAALLNR
jgi:hypothetical protein